MKAARALLLGAGLVAGAGAGALAGPYPDEIERACRPTVSETLARLGIGAEDIRYFEMRALVQQRRQRPLVIGAQGWVGLRACQGAIVIDMSRTCQVRSVYAKDGCKGQLQLQEQ